MTERNYLGAADVFSGTSEYNRVAFVVRSILGQTATTALVRVVKVTANGELAPVGYLDVQPMVAQLDGSGKPMDHGTIHNVPYFRLQGGVNAVVMDPAVGDIGICLFASHDISSVKTTRQPGNPGSRRRFSMADGLYIGGVLNGAPVNYIRFDSDGNITLKPAATVTIQGDAHVTGTLTADTDVIGGGKHLKTHTHGGVTTGGGTTGAPS